jgi:uncharacterized protein YtpQ (UPF0354 family)
MTNDSLATFEHPQQAYRLEYPAHWEHIEKDEGRSCGFGPRERDDVGLWISILPFSLDTDKLSGELSKIFKQAVGDSEARNVRADPTLRHRAMKADVTTPGEAGNFWIIAGGDLVLFASSQVPAADRATWNPQFERLMASLQITRDDELLERKVADDVIQRMRLAHPEQDYQPENDRIRGRDHVLYLGNLYRQVLAAPERREEIIGHFVKSLDISAYASLGREPWEEVAGKVLPVPKPHLYAEAVGASRGIVKTGWLADLVMMYAIRGKLIRFITDWDLKRWSIDLENLHKRAIENLTQLPWPDRLEGSRDPGGGRMILVSTNDSFDASRLLHPDLHSLFSGPLGDPFLAAIPDRDTLVLFSKERKIERRLARKVKEDHRASSHPLTPVLFLVTAAGIAVAGSVDRPDWGIPN